MYWNKEDHESTVNKGIIILDIKGIHTHEKWPCLNLWEASYTQTYQRCFPCTLNWKPRHCLSMMLLIAMRCVECYCFWMSIKLFDAAWHCACWQLMSYHRNPQMLQNPLANFQRCSLFTANLMGFGLQNECSSSMLTT